MRTRRFITSASAAKSMALGFGSQARNHPPGRFGELRVSGCRSLVPTHTPNGGGLEDWRSVLVGRMPAKSWLAFPWEVLHPKLIGVRLTGKLNGWASPKTYSLSVWTPLL